MRAKFVLSILLSAALIYKVDTHFFAASRAAETQETETIDLPFKDEPFAAFVRHRTLWLVADNGAHLSIENLRKTDLHFVTNVKQLPSQIAEVFVFTLNGDYSASVEKSDDSSLHIRLHQTFVRPQHVLLPSLAENKAKKYAFTIAAKSAKDVLSFTDPDTGKEILVVPLAETGVGFYPARSFVQFAVLQSAQGIVIQKNSDDITAVADHGDVLVTAPSGLEVSSNIVEQINTGPDTSTDDTSTLFPYEKWKLADNKNFVPTEEKLFHDIAFDDPKVANKTRLRLIQLYLANGLYQEAVGMSNDILRNSYKFYRTNKVAAMRGAAYFFMQRFEDAQRDFASPELTDDKEVKIWKTLCDQLMGDDKSVFDFPANWDAYISKYPPPFIQKMAMISADLSIKRKDFDNAGDIFRLITKASLDEPVQKYIEYMQAEILSETKSEEDAQKIWERETGYVDDPLIRASAEYSLVDMLLRNDKIATDKAIRKLERQLIVWRGDSLELNILTLLSSLYIEEKNYTKALSTMRDIVRYFPNTPQVIQVSTKMEEIFTTLFNKGGADNMSPVDALTLFYEFRDLVPVGRDGDMMVRNLADRLAGVDLLDRAAMLLEHQVDKRLHGEERSRVGARLASIYLQNHKPKEALSVLQTTGYGKLPADLMVIRTHLTSQALAEEGHSDRSIDVLTNDNTTEGNMLRLSVYWGTRDWPNVTLTAEEILGNRNDPTAPLTNDEADVLLKLATSYVYERDNGQLQYLRDYFTPLLKGNPDRDSFLFITSESVPLDYNNLATLDGDISTIKSYIETSRAQAKKKVVQ